MAHDSTLGSCSKVERRHLSRAWVGAAAVVAVLMALSLGGCGGANDKAEEPPSIVGVWETGEWERQSGETLEHIPAKLSPERWTITRPTDCAEPACVLNLTTEPLGRPGGQFETQLRPAEDGSYVAEIDFVSACTDRATGQVREANASAVTSTYEVSVVGDPKAPELAITAVWEGQPTAEGLAAGCNIKKARYEATAQPASS